MYKIYNKSKNNIFLDNIKIGPSETKKFKKILDNDKLNFLVRTNTAFVIKLDDKVDLESNKDVKTSNDDVSKKSNKKPNKDTINNIKSNEKLDKNKNKNLGDEINA